MRWGVDLDRFKAVNDSAGHAAGDSNARARVTDAFSINRSGDLTLRLGGDEFGPVAAGL